MKGFTRGFLLGGALGLAGLGYMIGDRRTVRRMKRDSRKVADKAGEIMDMFK